MAIPGRRHFQTYFIERKCISLKKTFQSVKALVCNMSCTEQTQTKWRLINVHAQTEPVFYVWLRDASVNEWRRYICNIYSHWRRPCSTLDRNWAQSITGFTANIETCVAKQATFFPNQHLYFLFLFLVPKSVVKHLMCCVVKCHTFIHVGKGETPNWIRRNTSGMTMICSYMISFAVLMLIACES